MTFVKTLSLHFLIRRSSTMVRIYINKMWDSHLVPVYVALYKGMATNSQPSPFLLYITNFFSHFHMFFFKLFFYMALSSPFPYLILSNFKHSLPRKMMKNQFSDLKNDFEK